jgi:hypothetical protein
MPNELNSATDSNEPRAYQIRLKGQLDSDWAEWLGGLSITPQADDTTRLITPAIDQAALHGLLKKVRDLGLPLISVNPLESARAEGTSNNPHQSPTEGKEK